MANYSAALLQGLRAPTPLALAQRETGVPQWWPQGAPQSKAEAATAMEQLTDELSDYQERFFAASRQDKRQDSVLLVLQGMDTSGKGGIVRHVVGMVDPQGVRHHAFKTPSAEEQAHDFLWRIERELPAPGMIGVFDRSHYEDVLIHRVQKLSSAELVEARYAQINDFEQRISQRGTRIIKVMLHISREEQYQRLAERLKRPDKYWKYSPGDVADRLLWDEYQQAYQVAIERTNTEAAPWYVIPADHKWLARLCVAELLTDALRQINPQWPAAHFDVAAERRRLEATR